MHLKQLRTIILPRKTETVEELMMTRFDLQQANQKKGAFNSRPHVEIEYSICLYMFLPLNGKRKIKLNSCFSFL